MQDLLTGLFQWIAGGMFYAVGRTTTRLFGQARTTSGWPETLLGFAIFALSIVVVVSIVKFPVRIVSSLASARWTGPLRASVDA